MLDTSHWLRLLCCVYKTNLIMGMIIYAISDVHLFVKHQLTDLPGHSCGAAVRLLAGSELS